jgi:hypothetical protein
MEYIFIVLVLTKYFLGFKFILLEFFYINEVYKVRLELGKGSSFKERRGIHDLFLI